MLFTDGSVNVQTGIGFGAYLLVNNIEIPVEELKEKVKLVRFEETSSTKLELQTLLHVLNSIPDKNVDIEVYSDSQNILGLLERRNRLEQNDFRSKGDKLFKNAVLYQDFFKVIDSLNCTFIKVKGHQKTSRKNRLEQVFTLVDRASRKALRNEFKSENKC